MLQAAFRRLLTFISQCWTQMLGGTSLSSSRVGILFTGFLGSIMALNFFSSIAEYVPRLRKVAKGAIIKLEVSNVFKNLLAPASVSKNLAIWASNLFLTIFSGGRSNITCSTTINTTDQAPLCLLSIILHSASSKASSGIVAKPVAINYLQRISSIGR